jgi:nicotinamidase-related amidase
MVVVDMTRAFTDPSSGVGSDQADTVDATAQVLAAARERGDVVDVPEVLEYPREGSVEEAAE